MITRQKAEVTTFELLPHYYLALAVFDSFCRWSINVVNVPLMYRRVRPTAEGNRTYQVYQPYRAYRAYRHRDICLLSAYIRIYLVRNELIDRVINSW